MADTGNFNVVMTLNDVHPIQSSGVSDDHYFKLDIPKKAPIKKEAGKSYVFKAGEVFGARMNPEKSGFTEVYRLVCYNEDTLQAIVKPIKVNKEDSEGFLELIIRFGS